MVDQISLAAALFVSVLGGWTALWQHTADIARASLRGEPPAMIAASPAIDHARPVISGDSHRRHLRLGDVTIRGVAGGQSWIWRAGEVIVALPPAEPDRLTVLLPSPQTLSFTGPRGTGAATLWAKNLTASLELDPDGRLRKATVTGEEMTVEGPGLLSRLGAVTIAIARGAEKLTKVEIALERIDLPSALRFPTPLGGVVQRAAVDGWVSALGPPSPSSPVEWRDAGGVVGLAELDLRWGALDLALSGRAALDKALRPQGRLSINLRKAIAAVGAAHAAGAISARARDQARRALTQIAHLRGGQDDPELTISLTMAGGYLSWAGLTLAPLPVLAESPVMAEAPEAESAPAQ